MSSFVFVRYYSSRDIIERITKRIRPVLDELRKELIKNWIVLSYEI